MDDRKAPGPIEGGQDADEIEREAEKNREKLDSIPEPGTDPLHEGP